MAQVYAFTTDLTEAQDAVQEAFARALARRGQLGDIDAPEAWLRTVAVNIVAPALAAQAAARHHPVAGTAADPDARRRTRAR